MPSGLARKEFEERTADTLEKYRGYKPYNQIHKDRCVNLKFQISQSLGIKGDISEQGQ
jgi:hypothetical protein